MSAVILAPEVGDAYRDATLRADNPTRRYTVYVCFPLDPDSIEEIDVDAATDRHARQIAVAALARDYEPGGRIVSVEERFGLYF